MPKCTSWLGHKFEGRYSEVPGRRPSTDELFWNGPLTAKELISASIKRTYERDVCIRCGATIERQKPSPETQQKSTAATT